jgi:hypothetical protein
VCRSLSGEQLVFSNNDLLSSRIRNYGQMAERRIRLFGIGFARDILWWRQQHASVNLLADIAEQLLRADNRLFLIRSCRRF